jgi:hypothetical protein
MNYTYRSTPQKTSIRSNDKQLLIDMVEVFNSISEDRIPFEGRVVLLPCGNASSEIVCSHPESDKVSVEDCVSFPHKELAYSVVHLYKAFKHILIE